MLIPHWFYFRPRSSRSHRCCNASGPLHRGHLGQSPARLLVSYSLALTRVDGGLVQPAGSGVGVPPLSPELNFTLYAENTRLIAENCFSHGRVVVSYGGVALGEGRMPGFCAGARSTAEVSAAARGVGVRLPDGQRSRLEAELRWGAAEFDVEAKLFRDTDDETRSPVLLWCKAAGPQLPPQPLRCKSFH